jgi:DNA (cytosine-5)-methyltransferase 1
LPGSNVYTIFSFFAGSGLLDIGFEDADFNVVFVNEYHKPFLEAYKYAREKLNHAKPKYDYSNEDIEKYLLDETYSKQLSKHVKTERKNNNLRVSYYA